MAWLFPCPSVHGPDTYRLPLWNECIVTARPVEHGTGPPTDVRFGVLVTVNVYRLVRSKARVVLHHRGCG